jgi:hypothetical protein
VLTYGVHAQAPVSVFACVCLEDAVGAEQGGAGAGECLSPALVCSGMLSNVGILSACGTRATKLAGHTIQVLSM